ncbi:unnamed protein product [Boreogadus saida]
MTSQSGDITRLLQRIPGGYYMKLRLQQDQRPLATGGMDSSKAARRLGRGTQCVDGAPPCGPPAWATVGMDLTREELQKELEGPDTGLLDVLAYGGLALGLVVLLAFLVRQGFTWMSQWAQSTRKENPEALKARDEELTEWLVTLERKMLSSKRRRIPENAVPEPLSHAD